MEPFTEDRDDPAARRGRSAAPPGALGRAVRWLDASPVELLGLLVLLAGAIVLTAVVVWSADRRPDELPPAARAGVGSVPVVEGPAAQQRDTPGAGEASPTDRDASITVHVSGAVQVPGVVTLQPAARVADAIAAAGGATPEAEPNRINLARLLVDGERVHVPRPGEDVATSPAGSSGEDARTGPSAPIDLNLATHEQLEGLPGIGPAKAAAIITHRETEGPFAVPGDLRGVPGIGERTFQRLADLVTVG